MDILGENQSVFAYLNTFSYIGAERFAVVRRDMLVDRDMQQAPVEPPRDTLIRARERCHRHHHCREHARSSPVCRRVRPRQLLL